jgi:uncharacterized protein (TIGR00369 family)
VWRELAHGATIDARTRDLDGLAQLRAVREQPAMYHLTGTTFDGAASGEATFSMPITGWLLSSQGAVPGGMLAIPADGALGCAIHTKLPAGVTYTTAELSITYLHPPRVGMRVRASGRALHVGRTLAMSSADMFAPDGALLAHATSRCVLFSSAELAPRSSGTAAPPSRPGSRGSAEADIADPFLREPSGTVLDSDSRARMSGLDLLRAQIAGELPAPPLHHLLGLTPVTARDGGAECVMPVTSWLNTPWGWPQGGFVAALADSSLAMAVQTTVPAGTSAVEVDLKVNYLRPVVGDGRLLHAHAQVAHRGRSLAVATAEVVDDDGRRVALATGSAVIRRREVDDAEGGTPEV